jgi:peptide/nickel transport system substrate-binding protein
MSIQCLNEETTMTSRATNPAGRPRRHLRPVVIGAAALAGGTALAACGSSAGTSNGAAGSPGTTLTIQGGNGGNTIQTDFNPFQVATLAATSGTDMLYLPLEGYDSLTGQYTPFLATGEDVVSARQVDFTLRSGVKWSDGKPVTTADVEFTFGLLKKFPALDTTGVGQVLQSVSASGNTLVFTLKTADSQIAPDLAQVPIVPAAAWSAVSNPVTSVNADPSVTDGPYQLENASLVKVVYRKNPSYYGIAQMTDAPDTVTVLPQEPGAAEVLDLEKGVFDWNADNDADRGGLATDWVAKDPAANHYWLPASALVTLYLNLAKAPFNDLRFRQALDYGINRTAVSLHANVSGYESAVSQTGLLPSDDNLVPASVPGGGNVTYDPAKAKQILLSDGYHYSGGKLIGSNGQPVTFTLQTIQGFVDWLGEAEEIAAELGTLGISVQVSQVQLSSGVSSIFSGEYDTAIYFSGSSPVPYANYQALLASYLTAPVGQPARGNYERLNSAQADGLLTQIASTTSTVAQDAAIGSLVSEVYNSVPVIELTIQPGWFEYSTKNYTGWPDAANPYANPGAVLAHLEIIPRLRAA